MDEYRYELKIPKERVAVLIGKDGSIKKEIEKNTKTKQTKRSKFFRTCLFKQIINEGKKSSTFRR